MLSILIADDEQLIRDGITKLLAKSYSSINQIFTAQNAYEAISILSSEEIDLIITDINMPNMSGLDLVEWIQINSPSTISIIISGYDKFEYAQKAIRNNVADYILKPINKKELLDKVEKIGFCIEERKRIKNTTKYFERVFYLRKLLENSFLSNEELEEIKMRLEIPGLDTDRFVVLIVDMYSVNPLDLQHILDNYVSEQIGIYMLSILPFSDVNIIIEKMDAAGLKYAIGSEQNFDSLCISYRKAIGMLRNNNGIHVHSFYASFSDHVEIMKLLSFLSNRQYEAVDAYLVEIFSHFENASAAKHWCLWFMDCIEEYFEQYKFTGIYQEAVKSSRDEDIDKLEEIFYQYIRKVYMTFEERVLSSSEIIVEDVKKMIEENISNKNFSLTVLSDSFQMSYGYLSSVFKQVTGQNFSDYLTSTRMNKAKQLLESGKKKLYEVADECGYSSYRYFSECFKKHWKKSPSEYQNEKHSIQC